MSKIDRTLSQATLKTAVDKLQKFVSLKRAERDAISKKKDFHAVIPFKIRPFAKLVATFVSTQISSKKFKNYIKEREREKKELFSAIDVIKTHHRLIEKLQKGNVEEMNLADLTHKAIKEFNLMVLEAKKPPRDLREKIRRFFNQPTDSLLKKSSLLSLPAVAKLYKSNLNRSNASTIDTLVVLPHLPKGHDLDLFRMKVISKIEEKELLPISDLHKLVRINPVFNTSNSEGTLSLNQTCIPLPGERLDFMASYEKSDYLQKRGIPIGDISYRLTARQTGFPDPALTSGLGFFELFIPTLPLRPEMAPTLELLLDRKQEVAYAMLPQGALNQKAKLLYFLHKQLYEQDPSYFITQHKAILEKLFLLLGATSVDTNLLKNHFSKIQKEPPTYEELSSPYHCLNRHLEICFENIETNLLSSDELISEISKTKDHLRWLVTDTLLESYSEETIGNALDECLIRLFANPAASLILQSNSEKFNFQPPALSEAEMRIQSIVFFQQLYFFQQMEKPQEILTIQDLVTSLHFYFDNVSGLLRGSMPSSLSKRALFLVEEVEGYYNSRYLEKN